MKVFAEFPHNWDAVVKMGAQNDQGVRVEDDCLVLWKEERHTNGDGERDQEKIEQLTAMTGHLRNDESAL